MTDYPFVPAWYDRYGARKGPTLGLMLHMAEGGGTVGYLDKNGTPPSRGVSVHAVAEYSGRVVQMLPWGDASGSLNPADRSTDKAYFGHGHLVDVLGDWWTDPNSAVISIEIEGFARDGPNARQVPAVIAWARDMVGRYPSIRGALGHADQTDTKRCPGATDAMRSIYDALGGHGLWIPQEDAMIVVSNETPMLVDLTLGAQLYDEAGHALVKVSPTGVRLGVTSPFEAVMGPGFHGRAVYVTTGGQRVLAFVHNEPSTNIRPIPAPPPADCSAVEAQLTVANGRITRAITDLGGTPPTL